MTQKLADAFAAPAARAKRSRFWRRRPSANPEDTLLSLKVAALQAWFGQEKELAATRQRILAFAKGTSDVATAERAAKACSLLPSTDKAELEAALALGSHGGGDSAREGSGPCWPSAWRNTAAATDAAADEALLAAAKAGPNNPSVTGTSAFYRAMSLFRQGKPDEARKLATAAAAKMKPLPSRRAEPAGRRCQPRRPDPVAGLQGSEGPDQVRRGPAAEGGKREEMRWCRYRSVPVGPAPGGPSR